MFEYTLTLADIEKFILVLVRISAFVYIAPFFSMTSTPNMIKIGFSFFVSILCFSFVDMSAVDYTSVFGYGILVLKETMTGFTIGFAANICSSIVGFAGTILDMDIGFAMAKEFDPVSQTQVSITGNLYQYFLLMMLVATGMERYILTAAVDSFEVIPLNGQNFNWDGIFVTIVQYMGDSFVIAFRIILPIFACIMILNCVLGIMAKVSPQMNMFAVGMQMKVLVGLIVLLLMSTMLPGIADFVFTEMKRMMISMIEYMA